VNLQLKAGLASDARPVSVEGHSWNYLANFWRRTLTRLRLGPPRWVGGWPARPARDIVQGDFHQGPAACATDRRRPLRQGPIGSPDRLCHPKWLGQTNCLRSMERTFPTLRRSRTARPRSTPCWPRAGSSCRWATCSASAAPNCSTGWTCPRRTRPEPTLRSLWRPITVRRVRLHCTRQSGRPTAAVKA